MSDFKDKDLVLPTREGRATGAANERTLLEAVGGASTIRTRVRANADGSETRLRTRDGFPEFVTSKPPVIEDPELLPNSFLGIPTSQTYQEGYSPVEPPKLLHEWVFRGSGSPPPNEHGSTAGPTFKATYAYSDLTPDTTIGQHTWYSNDVKVARTPLVVSWKGPMWRSGLYAASLRNGRLIPDSLDTTARSASISVPGRTFADDLATVDTWFQKAQTGFDRAVWLNGVLIDTDSLVWAAAIKKGATGEPSYLYYINELEVRRRVVRYKERKRGVERVPLDPVTSADLETSVVMFDPYTQVTTLYPNVAAIHLAQMPFINASCTKAVFLFHVTDSMDEVGMVLFEGDMSTGVLTEIMYTREKWSGMTTVGTIVTDTQTATGYGTGNTTYSLNSEATYTVTPRTYYMVSPMAADYVGDTLEYVYMESAHGFAGTSATLNYNDSATQTESSVINGNGSRTDTWSFNFSISRTRSGVTTGAPTLDAPAGVRLMSHLYGEIAKLDVPINTTGAWSSTQTCTSSGGYVRVFPPGGGGAISNTETNLDGDPVSSSYTRIDSTTSSSVQERAALVDADLRSRCYSFVLSFTTEEYQATYNEVAPSSNAFASYGTPSVTPPPPSSWSMTSNTLARMRHSACVVAFGQSVYRHDDVVDYDWNEGTPYTTSGLGAAPIPYGLGGSGTVENPAFDRPATMPYLHSSPQFTPNDGFFWGATLPADFWVHAPVFTSLAASTPKTSGGGQLAYFSVRFPDYGTLSGGEFHAFVKKSAANVSVFDCSGINYSPTGSSNRTIVRPIFLPTRLPK